MSFIDALGVASILPFVAILSNPQIIETNTIINFFYRESSILGVTNISQFLFLFGVVVFILLISSLIIRSLAQYFQMRFALIREYTIGRRLIEGYLHQPYTWFLNRHSADLGKNILSEVGGVIGGIIIPIISLISNSLIALVLLILCILVNPTLSLMVGLVLIFFYGCVYYFVKSFLAKAGAQKVQANQDRFKAISEALGAIKEVKVGGLEQVYIERFAKPAQSYAISKSLSSIIEFLPRYFIEAVAFGGMILLILILMAQGNRFENIIPIIAFYTFAGYRLIPALQAIYGTLTVIRSSKAGLDYVHKDFMNLQPYETNSKPVSSIPLKQSITFNKINFNYPNNKHATLKNINLEIPAFSKVGIVGPTGSGKTTVVDIILGLLDPSEGLFSVDNNPINHKNKRSWQKSIGYVPQQIYLFDSSIEENIAFGIDNKNINNEAVKKASKIANLHDFVIKELPNHYQTTIGERGVRLSGGQRQRIGIARALYHNPHVLIFDEATSALDNVTDEIVMDAINNLGDKMTIILIAHRLNTIRNCDKIFLLENGELKDQGSYNSLKKSNEVFKKLSGKE
jgi:ABC-type multidrug transport system fused ATPase/permease subunit